MIWRYAKKVLEGSAILVIVLLGVAAAAVKLQHGQMLSVQTGSMVPFLHKGDLVGVTSVPAESIKVGDVVTYMSSNHKATITHRVVETPNNDHPDQFIIKGDANPAPDDPVASGRILGKRMWSVRYLGYAVDAVRKPIGLALIIYVPALSIVAGELKRLTKYYESQRPYVANGYKQQPKGSVAPEHLHIGNIGGGLTALIVCLAMAWTTMPAKAELQSTATLTDNTISASKQAP